MKTRAQIVSGNSSDEVFDASKYRNIILAHGGDDVIYDAGNNKADRFEAGNGDDLVFTKNGRDEIFAGAGSDEIVSSNHMSFSVDGGSGQDSLTLELLAGQHAEMLQKHNGKVIIEISDDHTGQVEQTIETRSIEHFDW